MAPRTRMSEGEFLDYVAELVEQSERDKEAARGGTAAETGAGDPSMRLNLRPSRQPGQQPGGGGDRRAPNGYTTRGMPMARDYGTIHDRISPEEAKHVLDWWRALVTEDKRGAREAVERAHQHRSISLLNQRAEPQQISQENLGGVLAPQQFVDEVFIALPQETPFANGQILNIFPMGQDSVTFPKVTKRPSTGGDTIPEGSLYPESNAELGTVTLFARKQGVIIPVTEEMLMGSSVDIVRILAQLVAQELAEQRNHFVTNGSGAEEPEGVRTNANVATDPWDTTDDQSKADSLISNYYALQSRYRTNAIWLVHNTTIETIRQLKNTDGTYLWTDGFGATPATLLGRPVFENPDIPTDLGGGSDESEVLFGDFVRGYVFGVREGVTMQQDSSGDDWKKDIIRMKWRERIDGKVTDENAFIRGTGVQ